MIGRIYQMKSIMQTHCLFKYRLNVDKPIPNKPFCFGHRKMQVIHARLRNRCSSLNEHLYLKKLVQSPLCRFSEVESKQHYFCDCLFYRDLRFNGITPFSLNNILFGDENLSLLENQRIFNTVHDYIRDSKRFNSNV